MQRNKKGSPDARRIVANLAFRYRFARRLNKENPNHCLYEYANKVEAWNAYVASKKILLGFDP